MEGTQEQVFSNQMQTQQGNDQARLLRQVFKQILQAIGNQLSSTTLRCAIVYVSEESTDAFVEDLTELLELSGFSTISRILPGQSESKYVKQITDSDVILVIGTPAFKIAADTQPEGASLNVIIANLFTCLRDTKYKIIPILVECNETAGLPYFLRDIHSLAWNKINYIDTIWLLLESAYQIVRGKLTVTIDFNNYKKDFKAISKLDVNAISQLLTPPYQSAPQPAFLPVQSALNLGLTNKVESLDFASLRTTGNLKLKTHLKHWYEQQAKITYLFYNLPAIPIDQAPRLALVLSTEQIEKETNLDKAIFRDQRLRSFEDIYASKEPIHLKDIFNNQTDSKEPWRHLLILGRAGIGKTTLCKYIAFQWAQHTLWKGKFAWVFWIPLRNLNNRYYTKLLKEKDNVTLAEVIYHECFQDSKNITLSEIEALFTADKERILLLLDGYDEIFHKHQTSTPIGELLDELVNHDNCILTTRPHAPLNRFFDYRKLENIGFTKADIHDYISKFFTYTGNPLFKESLLYFIKNNPSVYGAAHIPINLELICSTWDDKKKSKQVFTESLSITALYQELVYKLYKAYLSKRSQDPIDKTTLSNWSRHKVTAECKPVKDFLEQLAFEGLNHPEGKITINNELLQKLCNSFEETYPNLFQDILEAGFLKGTGYQSDASDQDYYFLHLTFQEFFAASYWVKLFASNEYLNRQAAENIFIAKKFNSQYQLVWSFAAGLLQNNKKNINDFFNLLSSKPHDIISFQYKLLLISCMEECNITDLDNKDKNLKEIAEIINTSLGGGLEIVKEGLWGQLCLSPTLLMSAQVQKVFLERINNPSSSAKTNIFLPLLKMALINPQFTFECLFNSPVVCDEKAEGLNGSAVSILQHMAIAYPKQYFKYFINAASMSDRTSFRHISEYFKKNTIVNYSDLFDISLAIIKNRKSNDILIAVKILKHVVFINPKLALKTLLQIIPNFPPRFEDFEPTVGIRMGTWVRKSKSGTTFTRTIARILSSIVTTYPESTIDALIEALKEQDTVVKYCSAYLLKSVANVKPQEIFEALKTIIGEDNAWIKAAAIYSIGYAASIDLQYTFNIFTNNIKHPSAMIRWAIAEGLSHAAIADPKQALELLLVLIKDNHSRVAISAINSLSQVSSIDPKGIFYELIKVMDHEDRSIVRAAATSLLTVAGTDPELAIKSLLTAARIYDDTRHIVNNSLEQIAHDYPQVAFNILREAVLQKVELHELINSITKINPKKIFAVLLALKEIQSKKNLTEREMLALVVSMCDSEVKVIVEQIKNTKTVAIRALKCTASYNPNLAIRTLLDCVDDPLLEGYCSESMVAITKDYPKETFDIIVNAFETGKIHVEYSIEAIEALGPLAKVNPSRILDILLTIYKKGNKETKRLAINTMAMYLASFYPAIILKTIFKNFVEDITIWAKADDAFRDLARKELDTYLGLIRENLIAHLELVKDISEADYYSFHHYGILLDLIPLKLILDIYQQNAGNNKCLYFIIYKCLYSKIMLCEDLDGYYFLENGNKIFIESQLANDLQKLANTIWHANSSQSKSLEVNSVEQAMLNCKRHQLLGEFYYGLENIKQTVFHYEKSIQLAPETSHAYHNLACCYTTQGELEKAKSVFEQGIKYHPTSATFCVYGNMLYQQGHIKEAIIQLKISINHLDLHLEDERLSYGKLEAHTVDDALQKEIETNGNVFITAGLFASYLLVKSYKYTNQDIKKYIWLLKFHHLAGEVEYPIVKPIVERLKLVLEAEFSQKSATDFLSYTIDKKLELLKEENLIPNELSQLGFALTDNTTIVIIHKYNQERLTRVISNLKHMLLIVFHEAKIYEHNGYLVINATSELLPIKDKLITLGIEPIQDSITKELFSNTKQRVEEVDVNKQEEKPTLDYQSILSKLSNRMGVKAKESQMIPLALVKQSMVENFIQAAQQGDIDTMRELFNKGVDVNMRDSGQYQATALHYAAANGNEKLVKFLLNKGADPSLADRSGETAIQWVEAALRDVTSEEEVAAYKTIITLLNEALAQQKQPTPTTYSHYSQLLSHSIRASRNQDGAEDDSELANALQESRQEHEMKVKKEQEQIQQNYREFEMKKQNTRIQSILNEPDALLNDDKEYEQETFDSAPMDKDGEPTVKFEFYKP